MNPTFLNKLISLQEIKEIQAIINTKYHTIQAR